MRNRLTPDARKSDILAQARQLFVQNGYTRTEMEDIRYASGISRGGLYHHFANKGAILAAIVSAEIDELVSAMQLSDSSPIEFLLETGSGQLGHEVGILTALESQEEKTAYLSYVDAAISQHLSPVLGEKLAEYARPNIDPNHVAELFLIVNAHINRRLILQDWSNPQAAAFAATALTALVPYLSDDKRLGRIIHRLQEKGMET